MAANPWFASWNYDVLRIFFLGIPHTKFSDDFSEELLFNPLLSSWVFAACSYLLWTKDDEQRTRRRRYLILAAIAFGLAALVTLVLRPWVYWPAPVLNPDFQALFPRYLWGNGEKNCFPSHSTLAYFTIAVGFWPLNRRLSVCLSGIALLLISLPRIYEGGHYPIDVLFSCLLGTLVLLIVWRSSFLTNVSFDWSDRPKARSGTILDMLFFLWLFELGEGFRGTELLFSAARHMLWRG